MMNSLLNAEHTEGPKVCDVQQVHVSYNFFAISSFEVSYLYSINVTCLIRNALKPEELTMWPSTKWITDVLMKRMCFISYCAYSILRF